MRKIHLAPWALCLTTSLFSNNSEYDSNIRDQAPVSDQQQAHKPSPQKVNKFNRPANPPLKDGLNLWVIGEALLWQANEENLSYVQRSNAISSADSSAYSIKDPHFEWDWGFRVGLGYNMPRDGWDISLVWTHMQNHASGTQYAHFDSVEDTPYLLPIWNVDSVGSISALSKAHSSWTAYLEQADLKLGREYYIGKYLTIRPNGGLRADWIYQRYDIQYTPSLPETQELIKMHNRFFGFGFFGGADTDWLFGKGFSLYGNAAYAILLGFFDVDQALSQLVPSTGYTSNGKVKNSFRCGRSIIDLSLGLKWCHLFHHSSWGLTLKAGYEYHLYFDQNQFLAPTAGSTYSKMEGDLNYQGATMSAQIDF